MWWDLLDLSKQRKLLGMDYICPTGSLGGMDNLFSWKSVFVKHPTVDPPHTASSTSIIEIKYQRGSKRKEEKVSKLNQNKKESDFFLSRKKA